MLNYMSLLLPASWQHVKLFANIFWNSNLEGCQHRSV